MIDPQQLPNQEHGETTVLFLRRHWVYVAQIILSFLFLIALPIIPVLILQSQQITLGVHPFWGPVSAVFLSIYLFVVVTITITMFTDYYLDTWIVSNERIINIEQHGLFSRIIAELHLNQVQDVTSETHGMMATFLSFGDVYIQTAGTRERFNFKGIDNPERVKETILRLVKDDKRRHGDASRVPSMEDAHKASRQFKEK